MKSKNKTQSAHDLLAFLIVELGVTLPYQTALNLTTEDELFKALMVAWSNKMNRELHRDANLVSCIYDAMGCKISGRRPVAGDFIPKTSETREAEEIELMRSLQEFDKRRVKTNP